MAHWEDSPNGWRVSTLLEDAPTNLGVLRDANLVQNYGQDSGPLSFSESYTTNIRNSQAINEGPFGQQGQVEAVNLGGKLNDVLENGLRGNSRLFILPGMGCDLGSSKTGLDQHERPITHENISARSDNQNRTNSGPDSFSVANSSGVETGNVNEVKNELERRDRKEIQGSRLNGGSGLCVDLSSDDRGNTGSNFNDNFNNQSSSEITQSARINSPAQVAAFDAGNATNKQALDDGQMPQSNATNATMQSVEFAKPSGWGKLWRMVENGNYYYYELRFINAKRVRRKGGKITPQIAKQLNRRKGKGRHKESRKDAERMRSQAEHIARSV